MARRLTAVRARWWLLVLVFLTAASAGASAQSFWDELLTGIELSIGQSVAAGGFEEYGPPARLSPEEQQWLAAIFCDIAGRAQRQEVPYSLTVLGRPGGTALAP